MKLLDLFLKMEETKCEFYVVLRKDKIWNLKWGKIEKHDGPKVQMF